MLLTHVLLGLTWTLYGGLHSVLASLQAKRFFQKKLGPFFTHYRLAYTFFAFAGLTAVVLFQLSIPSVKVYGPAPLTNIFGSVVGFAGLTIMFVCIKKYF